MYCRDSLKTVLVLTGVAIAVTASLASAAGNQLGWIPIAHSFEGACPFSPYALADCLNPCDGGTDQVLMTAVKAPPGLSVVTGEEIDLDLQVAAPVLPPFWSFGPGECGDGWFLMEAFFVGMSSVDCKKYWHSASGGYSWYSQYDGQPNRARVHGAFTHDPATAGPMVAEVDYYTSRVYVGTYHSDPYGGDCRGCAIPACWVLTRTRFIQAAGYADVDITDSAGRNFVTWQGGAGADCPTATPARRATWGRVKSLYR